LKVFIGYDQRESVAAAVLAHSIQRHSSRPVAISFVAKHQLPQYTRQRGALESTDFSMTRFLVPFMCNYSGSPAVFMDCDMLVTTDIKELFCMFDTRYAVQVVKHDYTPSTDTKFLGNVQTKYARKNWSSLMLFNPKRCHALTPEYVNTATGMELHRFKWLRDDLIGELPATWNFLAGEYPLPSETPKNIHYTLGTPCFAEYANCDLAEAWHHERRLMSAPNES
jgi:lipopolysaccharide biosynthesis glycosyltransferase